MISWVFSPPSYILFYEKKDTLICKITSGKLIAEIRRNSLVPAKEFRWEKRKDKKHYRHLHLSMLCMSGLVVGRLRQPAKGRQVEHRNYRKGNHMHMFVRV